MASCCLGNRFFVFFFFKIVERGTVYHKSVIWRHKKPHTKVKNVVVVLGHRLFIKVFVFLPQICVLCRRHLGQKPKDSRVLQSEYYFQNSHVKHLFLTAVQCDLINAKMVVVDKNPPSCVWFLYKCRFGGCHVYEAEKWLKVL